MNGRSEYFVNITDNFMSNDNILEFLNRSGTKYKLYLGIKQLRETPLSINKNKIRCLGNILQTWTGSYSIFQ